VVVLWSGCGYIGCGEWVLSASLLLLLAEVAVLVCGWRCRAFSGVGFVGGMWCERRWVVLCWLCGFVLGVLWLVSGCLGVGG